MSNIYVQEPPTQGKVLLETSVGDIEVELWSKECPKASRNFVQLCLENYYNKTKFFRVVKDFIVQGGDPSNTGKGGESIYESGTFKDEFHSRLRFVRRGLVAMANTDEKDTNGSQFFFTMGQTPELQNKHTIFGSIAGDTIYNAMKLQDVEMDEEEAPLRPHKIYKTKVLVNPFPDIVPRRNWAPKEDKKKESRPTESKMKASKDFKLLSFGDEAEEEEEDLEETLRKQQDGSKSGKSSHDLLQDPKLSKVTGDIGQSNGERKDFEEEADLETLSSIRDKLKRKPRKEKKMANSSSSENDVSEDEEVRDKRRKKEDIRKEIKELQKSLKKKSPLNKNNSSPDPKIEEEETEEERNNPLLKDFHYQQKKFKEIQFNLPKKKSQGREKLTMQLLERFKDKLSKASEVEEPDLKDEDDDSGWMSHKLECKEEDPVLAKDASSKSDDWFDIYDPRNPINKRRRGDNHSSKRRRN